VIYRLDIWKKLQFGNCCNTLFSLHFNFALAGCSLDSHSPIIFILSIITGQVKALRVILDTVPQVFLGHPLHLVSALFIDIPVSIVLTFNTFKPP